MGNLGSGFLRAFLELAGGAGELLYLERFDVGQWIHIVQESQAEMGEDSLSIQVST